MKTPKFKTPSQKQADAINTLIHRRNLYIFVDGAARRVIDAHVQEDARVYVRDLYDENKTYCVEGQGFRDGYGIEGNIEALL